MVGDVSTGVSAEPVVEEGARTEIADPLCREFFNQAKIESRVVVSEWVPDAKKEDKLVPKAGKTAFVLLEAQEKSGEKAALSGKINHFYLVKIMPEVRTEEKWEDRRDPNTGLPAGKVRRGVLVANYILSGVEIFIENSTGSLDGLVEECRQTAIKGKVKTLAPESFEMEKTRIGTVSFVGGGAEPMKAGVFSFLRTEQRTPLFKFDIGAGHENSFYRGLSQSEVLQLRVL